MNFFPDLEPACCSMSSSNCCFLICIQIYQEAGKVVWYIKDRNGMDLTEAEDTKKTWQEYTDELYKKDLHDPDNHDGVITHLEPDILECEVSGP